jgi:hypothetical protein
MNRVILAIVFSLAGFTMGFGDNGRGSLSRYISFSSGYLWLGGLIYAFISGGVVFGLIAIPVSFIIGAITNGIAKALVTIMRN